MTNLTKDWKDGKLPSGWYYIKIADIVFIDFFEGKVWKNKKDEYIDEVLALVPTFDEWRVSEKYNKHLGRINMTNDKTLTLDELKIELIKLKNDLINSRILNI